MFLGRWWGQWLDPTRQCQAGSSRQPVIDEEESDGDDGGDEADDSSNGSSSPATTTDKRKTASCVESLVMTIPPLTTLAMYICCIDGLTALYL